MFFCSSFAAKAGYGREDFVESGAGCSEEAVAEGVFDVFAGFFGVELFFFDDCVKVGFFLFADEFAPVFVHVGGEVDAFDEVFNQFFFAAEVDACVDGFLDGDEDFFVFAVAFVVFCDEEKDVVDVDFHLLD